MGKGWMFFFGCIDIVSKPIEEEHKKQETLIESWSEFFKPLRTKIIEALNNSDILRNVSDLYMEPPDGVFFNPIVADIHIPVSLQNEIYRAAVPKYALIEDFKIVYDGYILSVAALCPFDRRPYGVYDVRDRFKAVLSPICTFEEISPCLTHESVVLVNKGEILWRNERDVFIDLDSSSSFVDLTKGFYRFFIFELNQFYDTCHETRRIEKLVLRVHELESLLINDLIRFLETNWREIRKRRKLSTQSKKKMIEILEGLSTYSYAVQENDKKNRYLNETREHNLTLNEFIIKITDKEQYNVPIERLEINSSMRLVEHVRIELEAYGANTSMMLSALAGAIIGSILTLVATYILVNLLHITTYL